MHEERIEGAIRLRQQPDVLGVLAPLARRKRSREIADGHDLPRQMTQVRQIGKASSKFAIRVGYGVKCHCETFL
ncbi:hypothetical protein GCM10010116_16090 [Microbispora rosea subsp. aerata]|nr:hypothetical protein GCM10010116_16090 [Microbispora rosea subsp. aerata]GIH53307.1 hypothetical protein Mro02_02210 [Microbispora rosea subsp. aerata]GLJ83779.1 hypothetical protein GCM10017588_25070 [Microbispora rosea subsp. aerata]